MKSYPTTVLAITLASAFFSYIDATEIDWERARELRQKVQQGQSLSEEEKNYLETAIEARSGMRGDGADETATVTSIPVSEDQSPVRTQTVTAADGNRIDFVYRTPKVDRPLPAVVFIHGGLGQRRLPDLIADAKSGPTHTRFLNAGYVAVTATFRTYGNEPQSRGPILDSIAIVQAVKKLPGVDPESVVIFGGSGGGSIALELAGSPEAAPLAVVAGEPATVLFTGVMTSIANRDASMKEYPTLYTDELRRITEGKISSIACPILIHHGDQHLLKRINFELVFPAIREAGKTIIVKQYPGEEHGFYWGNHTREETVDQVFANTLEFIEPLLKSQPAGR